MGFFSSIGSAISGAFSTVMSGLSGIASSIGSAIGRMCEALRSEGLAMVGCIAASILIPGVGLPELLLLVQSVAEVIGTLAKILGVNVGEDSAEELGMKAEIADRKPEDFDSIEEYIKYLNEEIELEDDAVEKLSDEDKVKYSAMGTALNIKAIEEKYDISLSAEFAREVTMLKLTGEQVKTYIDAFKENGISTMQDMTDYLKGKDTVSDKSLVADSIIDAIGELYPELDENEIEAKLEDMRTE